MSFQTTIPLRIRIPRRWPVLLGATLAGILFYQFITLQRGAGGELGPLLRGHLLHYLKMLLGYYLLFEVISVVLFLHLARWYHRRFMPPSLSPTIEAVLRYEALFLPFIVLAIAVFGPITNTLRYLAIFYPDYVWTDYFPEYFFTLRMWGNYIIPFLFFGYAMLNINLFLDYHQWQKEQAVTPEAVSKLTEPSPSPYAHHLEAFDEEGETLLPVRDIHYIEVENKTYFAYTRGRTYQLRQKLTELEETLDPRQFYRLNRSVLINLAFVKNYSYWENDKYIVRLDDGKTEFVMQRARLKGLKERLSGLVV